MICRENLSWYTDSASTPGVAAAAEDFLATATKHTKEEDLHTYQNFSRDTSLKSRYGKERVEKLKALKRQWDPKGIFTKQLLE